MCGVSKIEQRELPAIQVGIFQPKEAAVAAIRGARHVNLVRVSGFGKEELRKTRMWAELSVFRTLERGAVSGLRQSVGVERGPVGVCVMDGNPFCVQVIAVGMESHDVCGLKIRIGRASLKLD